MIAGREFVEHAEEHALARGGTTPRVLVVTGMTHFGRGGIQRETEHLLSGLSALGVACAILSDTPPQGGHGARHFPLSYPLAPIASEQVRHAIEHFRPDVVHAIGGGVRLYEILDRETPVPWVWTVHCVPPFERPGRFFLARNSLHDLLRNAQGWPARRAWASMLRHAGMARVIVHSPTIARQVLECGCDEGKVLEIPLGCAPLSVPRTPCTIFPEGTFPKVLSVAGFAHSKGVHDGVRAFLGVLDAHPAAHLALVGDSRDPRYLRHIRAMVEGLGIERSVSIHPDLPEVERLAACASADVYVQPSREEGFCLSFIEAAQLSPRLVGTDTGAIRVVAEACAAARHLSRVVPVGDCDAMARAVNEVLRERASEEALDARRRTLCERFAWSDHAARHLALYAEVAGSRVPTRATRPGRRS